MLVMIINLMQLCHHACPAAPPVTELLRMLHSGDPSAYTLEHAFGPLSLAISTHSIIEFW